MMWSTLAHTRDTHTQDQEHEHEHEEVYQHVYVGQQVQQKKEEDQEKQKQNVMQGIKGIKGLYKNVLVEKIHQERGEDDNISRMDTINTAPIPNCTSNFDQQPIIDKKLMHSISKAHQRQLIKELATKLHHLESTLQIELPALQQQLAEKELESTTAFNHLVASHQEEVAALKSQLANEKEGNISLARSVIKSNLRNKHICQEYQLLKDQAINKDREIKMLKESIVDLRTVMTRLPSGSCSSSSSGPKQNSPDDSIVNRTSSRLLKRKVGSAESAIVKISPEEGKTNMKINGISRAQSRKTGGGSNGNTTSNYSQQMLDASEAEVAKMKRLLTKKINQIAYLKICNTCYECSKNLNRSGAEHTSKESPKVDTPSTVGTSSCTPDVFFNTPLSYNKLSKSESVLSDRSHKCGSESSFLSPPRECHVKSSPAALTIKDVIIRKDKQIAFYRKKLAESYDELEQERNDSKAALRVSHILCFLIVE